MGGDGAGHVMLLKIEERLEAMALNGVFGERSLLEPQPGYLLLKVVVLLAGVAEVDVVRPAVAHVVTEAVEEAFEEA